MYAAGAKELEVQYFRTCSSKSNLKGNVISTINFIESVKYMN